MLKWMFAAAMIFCLASPAGAAQFIEVKELPNGFNVNDPGDLDFFDAITQAEADDLSLLDLDEGVDPVGNIDPTGAEYFTVKAAGYVALYAANGGPGDIDVADWGLIKPNGKAFVPGVSNVSAWGGGVPTNPIPEPQSIALFVGGGLLVGGTIWRRRRQAD